MVGPAGTEKGEWIGGRRERHGHPDKMLGGGSFVRSGLGGSNLCVVLSHYQ